MSTRLSWILSPRMSLQLYAQPLVSAGAYTDFKELARPRSYDFRRYGVDAGTLAAGTPRRSVESSSSEIQVPFLYQYKQLSDICDPIIIGNFDLYFDPWVVDSLKKAHDNPPRTVYEKLNADLDAHEDKIMKYLEDPPEAAEHPRLLKHLPRSRGRRLAQQGR